MGNFFISEIVADFFLQYFNYFQNMILVNYPSNFIALFGFI